MQVEQFCIVHNLAGNRIQKVFSTPFKSSGVGQYHTYIGLGCRTLYCKVMGDSNLVSGASLQSVPQSVNIQQPSESPMSSASTAMWHMDS